jgi:lactate dehydrogenase-like 2-hydroxyacid dehydrogenase
MMSVTLLWPATRWGDDNQPEKETAGSEVECIFVDRPSDVADEQWAQADALLSVPDPVNIERLPKIANCKIFVTPKVGFDNVDLKLYGDAGIPVCNVPDYGTQDVADHAMGMLLGLMKGINRWDNRLRSAPTEWKQRDNPLALRLSVAKVGLVGLGRIGTAMALRCKAFGMQVSFYDPYVSNGADLALNINRVESLEALFAESDIVSLHAPLSEETRDMVNADVLAHAKQGLVLINAARGEIVDLDALYDSMLSDQVGGVGLDVMPEEPLNLERKLIRAWQGEDEWIRDRLLITPHSAFYTPQSLYDMRTKGITVALKYLRTGKLENCVNQEYLKNVRPLT